MNILLCTDNNYIMPTGVLMTSIGMNCGKDVCYYIFVNEEFSNDGRKELTNVAERFGNSISFYPVRSELINKMPVGKKGQPVHITKAAYNRLFASLLLPKDVHKIIYMDCDMIVRHSLTELWNTEINEVAVGVVHDCDEYPNILSQRLPYPMNTGYFNSGLLLINVDYWRDNDCLADFIKIINDEEELLKMHDQDVLNIAFYDKKLWLPMTYNFQSSYVLIPSWYKCPEKDMEEAQRTMYDPCIIHYASNDKPWKITCYHPHTAVWRYYWRKSQWRNERLVGEEPRSLKDRIRMFALRHCLYMPHCQYQRCILKK